MNIPLVTYLYERPQPPDGAARGSTLDAFPFFLEHYRQLGDSEILIVLNVHGNPDLQQRVEQLCPPARVICEPLESKPALRELSRLLDDVRPDWYIKADLDEFHVYPPRVVGSEPFRSENAVDDESHAEKLQGAANGGAEAPDEPREGPLPLEEMLARLRETEANVVLGELVDYVSPTGQIVPIDPTRPLREQFPLPCRITRDILQGCTRKLMLCRGDLRPHTAGFHHADSERPAPFQGTVRHYKWHSDLLTRLEHHAHSNDLFRAESRRFLDWHHAGGLQRLCRERSTAPRSPTT